MIQISKDEYLLETLLEHCEDIITIKDLNLRYVSCNKAFLKLIDPNGEKPSPIGKTAYEVMNNNNANAIISNMEKVIKTGKIENFIFEFETCNNEILIFKQTNTPIIRNGVIEGVLSITTDVTREETLKIKLREKNNQLNSLLNNLPILAYMRDKDLNFTLASKNSKDFIKSGYDKFSNIHVNMKHAEKEDRNEDRFVMANKQTLVKDKAVVDINNKPHWYRVYKAPIFNCDGEVDGLITMGYNIDKEHEAENRRSLFLATLTHDLKNPLQAQISSLDLFYKGVFGSLTETQKEMLEMIIESSKYMRSMIYSLLKTCKEQNGVIGLERTYFDLTTMIDKCVKEVNDLASSKGIKIHYNYEPGMDSVIYADEIQMRRVVANILNNGINYAYDNTDFSVILSRKNNKFCIQFDNISEPISDDLASCIFDKYVCGNSLTSTIGVGLGLYFCHKVLTAHQGEINLVRDGNANTFVVELPILSEESAFISEIVL